MHFEPTRKESTQRRRIDLFQFGYIEYKSGANFVSGTFELTAPTQTPGLVGEDPRDRERGPGQLREDSGDD